MEPAINSEPAIIAATTPFVSMFSGESTHGLPQWARIVVSWLAVPQTHFVSASEFQRPPQGSWHTDIDRIEFLIIRFANGGRICAKKL